MITYSDDNEILLSCTKDMVGKIIIPNGVKKIASHAFKDCYEISEIILPDTISQIQSQAFSNCIYNHRTTKTNQKYPSVNL